MTQEELDKMPEAHPINDNLGVCYIDKNEPIRIIDRDGIQWSFALRMSDNKKVKVRV